MQKPTQLGGERLENRKVLAASSFVPPEMVVTADNPRQEIRVIVLNYDPDVPSEGRKLREVFGWNNPRDLADGFIDDVETASGNAVDIEIVEWRDLNEFPIFVDGFQHEADDYVQKRRSKLPIRSTISTANQAATANWLVARTRRRTLFRMVALPLRKSPLMFG